MQSALSRTPQILFAAVCGLLLTGCQQSSAPAQQAAEAATAPPAAAATAEYLDWQSARVNGTPLLGRTADFYQALGRPDSLIKADLNDVCMPYFQDKPFRFAYIKHTVLEVYGDTAVVSILDFRQHPALELRAGTIRLSRATTLTDLARHFPHAVQQRGTTTIYQLGKLTSVTLATSQQPTDTSWLLFFDATGHLIRMDYYEPC